jgi:hypothetical protein
MGAAADMDAANDLLGGDAEPELKTKQLNKESDYIKFGEEVNTILANGKTAYNMVSFFKETSKQAQTLDSTKLKKISDMFSKLYNEKVKEEKTKNNPTSKKQQKKGLVGGKGYDRNNNAAMISDMMGNESDEDAPAAGAAFKREEEAEVDFM